MCSPGRSRPMPQRTRTLDGMRRVTVWRDSLSSSPKSVADAPNCHAVLTARSRAPSSCCRVSISRATSPIAVYRSCVLPRAAMRVCRVRPSLGWRDDGIPPRRRRRGAFWSVSRCTFPVCSSTFRVFAWTVTVISVSRAAAQIRRDAQLSQPPAMITVSTRNACTRSSTHESLG